LKNLNDIIGMEELSIVHKGNLEEITIEDPYVGAFFMRQVIEEGLTDFHVTIETGTSKEEKINIIREITETWDSPKTEITYL